MKIILEEIELRYGDDFRDDNMNRYNEGRPVKKKKVRRPDYADYGREQSRGGQSRSSRNGGAQYRGSQYGGYQGAPTMRRQRVTHAQRRNEFIKTLIPVILLLVAIIVIVVVLLTSGVLDELKYSSKKASLTEVFGEVSETSAVMIVDGTVSDDKIHIIAGKPYVPLEEVNEEFHNRFYYDVESDSYLYTKATMSDSVAVGEKSYIFDGNMQSVDYTPIVNEGEEVYMALDYLMLYKNLSYVLAGGNGEPYRIKVDYEWGNETKANVKKEQAVRVAPEKKSEILKEMKVGDTVTVLETEGEFSKVQTEDLITGYIENKLLTDTFEETASPKVNAVPLEISPNSLGEPVILGWNNVAGVAGNDGIDGWLAKTRGMNVISPTWFTVVDDEGTITSIGSKSYVDKCHAAGVQVWGLFDNLQHLEVSSYEIFSKASKRASMINQLLAYADEYGLDGINLDIESIPTESGAQYVQFIRELSIECRNRGLILSVDNYVPRGYNDHYNREEQGVYADYVIIMGYDEHYVGSRVAGSVASLGYVKEGIENTLKDVPADKIINAVPLYTRLWMETPKTEEQIADEAATPADDGSLPDLEDIVKYTLEVQTLDMNDGLVSAKASGAPIQWDEEAGQNYATWEKGGKTYEIWLEDDDSLRAKLNAMQGYNIAGVAAWQIDYGDSSVWSLFSSCY